ncbi:30s ribosomal protein s15 [Moniliophthora roreri MCA 2997]|uniref:30s ribosomal protein s15 n=1 Tax=Moniliophthora roreri (strain MCA 2997) TaxID=1381753 RepID=V2YP43_MONRO|nr:30s ribosomal protein s15 [Moniliophthora roreri MCA 2997]
MAPRLSLFGIITLTSTLLLAASTCTLGVILTTIIRGCGIYSACSTCSLVIGGLAMLTLSLMIGIDLLHPGALMSMVLAELTWISIVWLVGTAFSLDEQAAVVEMRSIQPAFAFLLRGIFPKEEMELFPIRQQLGLCSSTFSESCYAATMFRACIAQSSRSVASTSNTSLLHTSAVLHAKPRLTPAKIRQRKAEKWEKIQANKPSPILGTRPGEEWKWEKCDLAKMLIKEEELTGPLQMNPTQRPIGVVHEPEHLAFAVTQVEAEELFGKLPMISSSVTIHESTNPAQLMTEAEAGELRELRKANMLAKVLDLRNANAEGIAYENRRRIIEAFSTPENPFDPGRQEVQAAILTYRIRNLWNHLSKFRRDVGNRRGLRQLVHQRAKVLKYLKRNDRERYDTLLERLALEPESVEGELVV